MRRQIQAVVGAILLLLSGNAMAVLMDSQIYGNSGYSLEDFDVAIQALQDEVSSKKEKKRLKKAQRLDRKIERLVYKVESAMALGKENKLRKKSKKLIRKETKLLDILADYLPDLNELLQNDEILTSSSILLTAEITPPQPGLLPEPVTGNPGENTQPGTVTTLETPVSGPAAVPEPSMLALLSLGIAGLMFPGFRRRQSST